MAALIEIPDLYAAGAERLSACGRVYTKDKELRAWASDHDERFYCYQIRTASGVVYCHVGFDNNKEYIHLHVDLSTKTRRHRPAGRIRKEEVELNDLMKPFLGHEIKVYITGDFIVSVNDLPPMLKALGKLPIATNDVALRITGCTFSIEGSPVTKLSWETRDKTQSILGVAADQTLTLAAPYLNDCLKIASSYSDLFVQTGTGNA